MVATAAPALIGSVGSTLCVEHCHSEFMSASSFDRGQLAPLLTFSILLQGILLWDLFICRGRVRLRFMHLLGSGCVQFWTRQPVCSGLLVPAVAPHQLWCGWCGCADSQSSTWPVVAPLLVDGQALCVERCGAGLEQICLAGGSRRACIHTSTTSDRHACAAIASSSVLHSGVMQGGKGMA